MGMGAESSHGLRLTLDARAGGLVRTLGLGSSPDQPSPSPGDVAGFLWGLPSSGPVHTIQNDLLKLRGLATLPIMPQQ